jgi:RNA polymerase sigma-70 factor, ECF subfamily
VRSEVESPSGVLQPPADVYVSIRPQETFDSFYRHQYPGLVALARALTGRGPTAEDLAQEAMMAAYRRWDEVSMADHPAAWVHRVCANQATSAFRRRQAEVRALLWLGGRRRDTLELGESSEAFWAHVRRLPRRQAQVVALHYALDLSVDEVAATLGVTSGTVKVHLSGAREVLSARADHT